MDPGLLTMDRLVRSRFARDMTSTPMLLLTVAAAVLSGLVGGVFFAFSTFVMGGLRRLAPRDAVVAMQAVNVAALTPPFMALLFGTGAAGLAVAVAGALRLGDDGAVLQLVGGLAYLPTLVVTATYHVPRNVRLDRVDADGPEAEAAWRTYDREWTRANHLRTLSGAVASTLLVLAAHGI